MRTPESIERELRRLDNRYARLEVEQKQPFPRPGIADELQAIRVEVNRLKDKRKAMLAQRSLFDG
jgi:hypothetical protein